jgi:hypothetical protein
MLLQRPEDTLILDDCVEKLEAEQARPPTLPWDCGSSVPRDTRQSNSWVVEVLVWLNSRQFDSGTVDVLVWPNSTDNNACNRLDLDRNVLNSVRSANYN